MWSTGSAESPSGDSVNVTEGREFRSNVIVFMRCLVSSQQHNCPPVSSPIEHLQLNAIVDCHKCYAMGGRVVPSCSFRCNCIASRTRENTQSCYRKHPYEGTHVKAASVLRFWSHRFVGLGCEPCKSCKHPQKKNGQICTGDSDSCCKIPTCLGNHCTQPSRRAVGFERYRLHRKMGLDYRKLFRSV